MKKIQEMTHAEIIKLTQDDIDRMAEIACAERGIKPVERPEKPEELPEQATIPGYHIGAIVVDSLAAAESIEACLKHLRDHIVAISDYCWNTTEPKKVNLKISHTNIAVEESKELQQRRADLKNELAVYEEALKRYQEYSEQYGAVMIEIGNVWYEHLEKERKILSLKKQLKRYLDLADNNVLVSMRFFSAAFTDDYQEVKDLFDPEEYLVELKAANTSGEEWAAQQPESVKAEQVTNNEET